MPGLFGKVFKKEPKVEKEGHHILERVHIFGDLSSGELAIVEGYIHSRDFGEGEVIMYQGAAGHGMYIIVEGTVTIALKPGDPALAELHSGEFFGELAILDNSPRSASAVAKTACRTLGLFRADLFKLIEANPRLGVKVISRLVGIVGDRLRKSNEMVRALQLEIDELKKEKAG